ncbi:DUF6157 family protein [Paenibacillus sp. CC-CFT747]|nr:DUF6157 family protein [Paenibacillus sp. CC-CFT747]
MEWNYYNTFITVSADCPAEAGTVPAGKKAGRTKPEIEFELLSAEPYRYTQEELLYEVHVRHKEIPEEEQAAHGTRLRDEFYQKPQPCLRASMLPKKYGWGLHFDGEGRIALYPVESPDYRQYVEGKRGTVRLLAAMRNSRK